MNRFLQLTALAMLVGVSSAYGGTRQAMRHSNPDSATEAFRWAPKSKAASHDWTMRSHLSKNFKAPEMVTESNLSFTPGEDVAYLDMPDGSTWFVVTDYDKIPIQIEDDYVDYDITGVHAVVYNNFYEEVGRVNTEITKPEGYEKCTSVQFGPAVTSKFFNLDDNYELMLMANYKPEGAYGADAFTYVFSLRGADTDAVFTDFMKGYYTIAVNNSSDPWSEDFFMEFFSGETYTDTEMLYSFDIYTKASYSSPKATLLKRFDVDMVYVMSDGDNESMPVLMTSRGRELYVTVAKYEKTFFLNPFDWNDDRLSPDNHYLIDLYKKEARNGSELNLISSTSIPCEAPEDGYFMRSYCLGQFNGYDDISFDFGDGISPDYVISVVNTNVNEDTKCYFMVVDAEGNSIKQFANDHQGFIIMSPVAGQPEQYCFLTLDANGHDYSFTFCDYPSLEPVLSVPVSYYDGDDYIDLSMSLDRVPGNGSYTYAVAVQHGDVDDNNNVFHEVVWLSRDGKILHTDRINAGQDVNLINPYMLADGLNPYLFNTDNSREYLIFTRRQIDPESTMTRTELCVVNDREEMLMQYVFRPTDNGIFATLVNHDSNPALWIMYRSYEDGLYHSEFISLPFNTFEGKGTLEEPYLVATPGDLSRMRFNLNSHFRITDDLNFDGYEFPSVTGTFTGSLDGAGHTLSNMILSDHGMFYRIGDAGSDFRSFVSDLTLRNVIVTGASSVVADNAHNTSFDNVRVLGAKVEGHGLFGTITSNAALGTTITNCYAKANINRPGSSEIGGLVSTLGLDAVVTASAFKGSINGNSGIGGIASFTMNTSAIRDCHVNADITACNTVGGIVGRSSRGIIDHCLVEGSITATSPTMVWSEYLDAKVPLINAGGIVGDLMSGDAKFEAADTQSDVVPFAPYSISNSLVALSSLSIPDEESLAATAHRIVGRTRVNDAPKVRSEKYDEETQSWKITWGDPAAREDQIANNYALASLQPVDENVAVATWATEGSSIARTDLSEQFFSELGYLFSGYKAEEPWLMRGDNLAELYFEPGIGQWIEFMPATLDIIEGETTEVLLMLEEIDSDSLVITSSNEEACVATPVSTDDNGNLVLRIEMRRSGVYTIEAGNGNVTAQLLVRGVSGIADRQPAAAPIRFNGSSVTCAGCSIAICNAAGVTVAANRDEVHVGRLAAGVYVAVATADNGSRRTLKFVVR